jgi:hypothetical protein
MWTDLDPPDSFGGGTNLHPVLLSATRPGGRYRPALRITVRRRLFDGGEAPAWLKPGARVAAQLGSGPAAGQLRIVPGGRFTIGRTPKGGDDCGVIRLPVLPQQLPGKHRPIGCEFDFSDTWLAITLPTWCRPKPAVPQPALSPGAQHRARAA